jgi:hypothetical protein
MDITLSIPNRGAAGLLPGDPSFRYEVGRVKLLIDLGASPAGSSVTYNGTAVNLGGFANIGGDGLDYAQVAGATNRVAIELLLSSDFVGGDVRNFNYGNPNPRTVNLTLSGGGAPTALRWGAYAAATGFPGGAYRRVSGSAGAPTLMTVTTASPALPTTNGRLPLDVSFVMDRSGSMDSTIAPTTTTRFALLQSSINGFINAFSAEATSQSDDRLALVWFESTASVESFGASPWVTKAAGWAAVQARVLAQTTANMTALGDGVSQGVEAWRASGSATDPVLVLFTDGMQNAGNQISDQPPAGDLDYFDLNEGAYRPLRHRSIPMGAIGIGVPALYKATLEGIAQETGGGIYVDALPGVLGFGFHDQLITALKGNTLALLARDQGALRRGQGAAGPTRFVVGNDAPQLMLCLYWLGAEHREALDLVIIRPDGSQATPDSRFDDAYHSVQTVEKPERGDWQVFVVLRRDSELHERAEIPFYLSAIGTEGPFRMFLRHWAKAYQAGAELYLVLELEELGKPLDLKQARGRVTIEVRAPQIDLGAYLHDLPLPSYEQIVKVLGEKLVDIEDPLTLKLEYYSRLGYLGPLLLPDKPTEVISFTLGEGAQLPAAVQLGEGGLALRYDATQYPGTYRFRVLLELESEASGPIMRQEQISAALSPAAIDPRRSVVRGRRYDYPRTRYASLDLLLYDQLGNLIGPGYDDKVDVRAKLRSGRVVYQPNLSATASYSFRLLGLEPREDPQVQIRAFGQLIRDERLSALLGLAPGFPPWWRKRLSSYKRTTTLLRRRKLGSEPDE